MNHGSLFSGIGGFDLAAEWMGWENIFHCEWNDFGKRVLSYYWPNAISYDDISKTDFTIHRGQIDILTGGFPCQPYSTAGKRLGKEDDRHLWPEMLRAIQEIKPRWVVGENVFGIVNWNGGLVFHEVQADLEAEGYEVQPYVLPAAAVNAPHRRDRVWFVAHARCDGFREGTSKRVCEKWKESINADNNNMGNQGISKVITHPNGTRWEKQHATAKSIISHKHSGDAMYSNGTSKQRECIGQAWKGQSDRPNSGVGINGFENFPTKSPICNGDDGISSRLDTITFPKWRNESIKAGGNAIVPQVVYQIFKTIEQYETNN